MAKEHKNSERYNVKKWDGEKWEYLGAIYAKNDESDGSIINRAEKIYGSNDYLNISNFFHVVS